MQIQEKIINEINHIPPDKLTELYSLIHYFRLGGLHESQQNTQENKYPLRNTAVHLQEPFELVALDDSYTEKRCEY